MKIREFIVKFDKLMIGTFVKQYKFETDEERLKLVDEIKEDSRHLPKKISEFDDFEFGDIDVVKYEIFFNMLCELDHKAPTEYWHMKSNAMMINDVNLNITRMSSQYKRIE